MTPAEADRLVADALRALLAGDLAGADARLRTVLEAHPEHAHASALRGAAAHRAGDLEGARGYLERATELDPKSPEHSCNLAVVLCELERFDDAERILRRLLTLVSSHVEARMNLGGLLVRGKRWDDALACFDRVAVLQPELAQAHWHASLALVALGRPLEALDSLRRFRLLRPEDVEAPLRCAAILRDLGDPAGSAAAYREAIARGPVTPIARMEFLFTLRQLCAWDEAEPLLEELLGSRSSADLDGWVAPFFELSLPLSPARLQADAVRHGGLITAGITPAPVTRGAPLAGRRLRVGYVSADFREHPLAHLMQGLFAKHDRASIEVSLYSLGPDDGSSYRARIAREAEHFVDLAGEAIDRCVDRIREDDLDVVIDLMGYTSLSRFPIFGHRVARVQATYMGFAGTLGADCIDYQIVDRTIVPPALAPCFTERLVYLPDTYMVTDDEQPIESAVVTRAMCELPEEAVVFCCFNTPQKIEPEVFESWLRIMKRVPRSVLWLFEMAGEARPNLRRFAARRGVDEERIVFAPRWRKAAHLARLRSADVVLDTFTFGAHTTAVDALWAGVPVVTCPGATFASRVGASVLGAMGLSDLVAPDRDAYEALAVQLAERPAMREELRERLRSNRSAHALFDTKRFARHIERAFHLMYEAHVAGDAAAVIDVPRLG